MEDNITDRISELPGFIIHNILSYLDSSKELVRMSVLSNYWFELTASFPILDFSFHKFKEVIRSSGIPVDTEKDKLDIFFKFCEQNVSVHTFKLIISFPGPSEVGIIDRCLGLILEKGVKVLVIDVSYVPQLCQMYRVPNILASSLTSMKLRKCKLPSSLMVDVRFKYLKILHLISVPLNEEMITRLTTSCPFLEELAVKYCYGFKRFFVHGHLNLQQVEISFGTKIESIDIEAPNLCFLSLGDRDERGSPPFLNLTACKKLTKLHYYGKRLTHLSSNFPFLEDLFLLLPDECKSLNVSSQSLRTFMLYSKCDLNKIDINAPNLLLFGCTEYLGWFFPTEKNEVPSKARLEYDCHDFADDLWFKKLRQFLDKNVGFKELKLRISVVDLLFTELKLIQWPPFELEHVELEVDSFKEIYETVVDSLLWCCRPQSLTLILELSISGFVEWDKIVKYTYKKLLQQEDQVHTKIQFMMLSSSSNAKMNFSDLSALLTALPHDGSKQIIPFIKNEVVQEAGERNSQR